MEATIARSRAALPIGTGPVILCAAMLGVASVTYSLGGPSIWPIALQYVSGSIAICATSIFVFAFIEVAKLAKTRADRPIPTVIAKLGSRLSLLTIAALVLPLFLAGYTAVKSAIPQLIGFRYDAFFADIDAAIFGDDPWRLTHAAIGPLGTEAIEFVYVTMWIAVLGYSKALVALFADRRKAATFYTAMLATWFFGGFIFAYLMPAAGPVFAQMVGLEWRFAPLQLRLLEVAGIDSSFLTGPAYLNDGLSSGEAYAGGGISAMPSMHIGACIIYVLAARGTHWLVPSLVFLAAIFVGSIHGGYHYAVDAVVAAIIAWICWRVSAALYAGTGPPEPTASTSFPLMSSGV